MRVHLRQRKQTKKGLISLYLEIYKGSVKTTDGKTKVLRDYKYLNLYLVDKPKSAIDKQQNRETIYLAESIKAKIELEIKNGEYGFKDQSNQMQSFIEYTKRQVEKRKESKSSYNLWQAFSNHLINFAGHDLKFKEIDKRFCDDFLEYLSTKSTDSRGKNLKSGTVRVYYSKFKSCLKQAVEDKLITFNPSTGVKLPKYETAKREYLTLEELKKLAKVDCRYEVLKRAYLFSCLTGLRWSDIHKMTWSEVQRTDDNWRLVFHQKKTRGLQYLDISDQAREYLGQAGAPKERVFTGLVYTGRMNLMLQNWALTAGITKKITFHSARHTFAVLQMTLGTDIYTVSKLLGHSDIKHTQIYADIIDAKKIEAVNKIPDISI